MKQILILGGGVGGLQTALRLAKKYKRKKEVNITLVDEKSYHLFHATLYEVATSPEELTSLAQLKESVALPFKEIFKNKRISFVQGRVEKIYLKNQYVRVGERRLPYDYLVASLGSTSNFYNIPGAKENSFVLQSVKDAFLVRNRLEFLIQIRRSTFVKENLRIVIAGGGLAGVEMAAELKGYLDYLAWENGFPREKIETLVLEGAASLLHEMNEQTIIDASGRLRSLGVQIKTNSIIAKVDDHFVELKNGEKLVYDCLIWTAGVKANPLISEPPIETDRNSRIIVNQSLQVPKHLNIFVIGDQAGVLDNQGRPVPGNVPQAVDQAKFVAAAIGDMLNNEKPLRYKVKKIGYLIPLGAKWMILKSGPIYITGLLAYIIRELVFVHYFASIVGWAKAARLIWLENLIYNRND